MEWSLLLMLIGLAAAAALWHSNLGARELANAAALDTCTHVGAQLLDGTVAFRHPLVADRLAHPTRLLRRHCQLSQLVE